MRRVNRDAHIRALDRYRDPEIREESAMATLYVSPTGSGLRDGSSIENAGTLSNLSKFIGQAGPGGQVLLLADQGAYQQSTQLSIYNGGIAGAPVTIRGIDSQGNPMAAE